MVPVPVHFSLSSPRALLECAHGDHPSPGWSLFHARRTVGIRMALPTTERLLWHGGEHTAKPNIGAWTPIPPIP